jgi:transposase-like protein
VELVITDGHTGIMETVSRSFVSTSWQYCYVHFMRNLMKLIPKKKWASVLMTVKEAMENETLKSTAQDVCVDNGLEKVSNMFERWDVSLYSYMAFNPTDHKRLRTTNALERLETFLRASSEGLKSLKRAVDYEKS